MLLQHVMAKHGKPSHTVPFVPSGADVLRITVVTDTDGTVVRMAGRLAGDQLEEARRVCLTDKPHLLIDASELQSADADGVAFLATILDGGGRVEGLSAYVAMRLRSLREGRGG